jgi:alcohol dehydrogenase YqhD (iron-dependent ADH family)
MENFVAHIPTRLHFGKDVVKELGKTAKSIGHHALLVYGKGSVLRNGSYDAVKKQLDASGINITEYNGIKPNPVVSDVDKATSLGRLNNVDMVVAVGGGSVIDSAKIISLCIAGNYKGWDVMKHKVKPTRSLPLIAVLTLAATGTEMNPFSVIQNPETKEKIGYANPLIYPAYSFLDPQYTSSVPVNHTAYGIADLVAHCLEAYFGGGECSLSDRFVFAIIQEAMEYGPALLNDPHNYDLRARIMWAATTALNGLTLYGKANGDFGVHDIGHTLSFLYDTPHGASLTIAFPAWMKVLKSRMADRLVKLGENLFNTPDPDATIAGLETFFRKIQCPVRMSETGIGHEKHTEILELMNQNNVSGNNYSLSKIDRENIVAQMA